jgi:cell division transport system ATP-binding protein
MLAAVGLSGKEHVFPLTLSGGEQQRVSIARALIHKPRVILADEPTGNLDQQMTDVIFDLLLEANAAGSTVIVATHNLSMIENLNLRTIVLNKGAIVGDFENPRGIG